MKKWVTIGRSFDCLSIWHEQQQRRLPKRTRIKLAQLKDQHRPGHHGFDSARDGRPGGLFDACRTIGEHDMEAHEIGASRDVMHGHKVKYWTPTRSCKGIC